MNSIYSKLDVFGFYLLKIISKRYNKAPDNKYMPKKKDIINI
jgi:hypothetical protein